MFFVHGDIAGALWAVLTKGNGISSFASALTQISSGQANLKDDVIERLKEMTD